MIWRRGSISTFRLVLLLLLAGVGVVEGARSYRSTLRRWTRHARDYTMDNLEMRLSWQATYLGPEFREARLEKLATLQEWSDEERERQSHQDGEELRRYDEFFIGIYAGSSAWPEVGKNTGLWRIVLETGSGRMKPIGLERVPISEMERMLFPYLSKWSHAYRLRFPKTIG